MTTSHILTKPIEMHRQGSGIFTTWGYTQHGTTLFCGYTQHRRHIVLTPNIASHCSYTKHSVTLFLHQT